MNNPTEFAMFGRPVRSVKTRHTAARVALGIPPEVYALLLTCARIGLDSGPILTPEQRALAALLTALEGDRS